MAWYSNVVKRALLLLAALLACTLLLSACSPASLIPSSDLAVPTPTATPSPAPAASPATGVSPSAYDSAAGNCVDAANNAISLINASATGAYGSSYFNLDMRLTLDPHTGAACASGGAKLKSYRQSVGVAELSVYPLDGQWYYAGTVTRSAWLTDVLNRLRSLYPSADITVKVTYNGSPCGSASIGSGVGHERQINGDCS